MILNLQPLVLFTVMINSKSPTSNQGQISIRSVDSYLIAHAWHPTKEECDKLFIKMSKGCDEARKELIERHVRLVASIALKFRQTCVPMEDIMAEGIHGLVVALDKFDHTRGIQAQHLQLPGGFASVYKGSSVKCPALSLSPTMYHKVKEKENLVRTQLSVDLGRNPSETEVNEVLGKDRNLSNRVKFAPGGTLSLDEPLGEDSNQTLADMMSAEEEVNNSYREDGSLSDDMSIAQAF